MKNMTICYQFEQSLYVNVTNRCNYSCTFCLRQKGDGVVTRDSLFLEREPTKEEIFSDISSHQLEKYQELVFCGYGEPIYRVEEILWSLSRLKEAGKLSIPVRINTNGSGNQIHGRDITPELEGLVDSISISLNASNAANYAELCRPDQEEKAYQIMLDFAVSAKKYVPKVMFTLVDTGKNQKEIQECRKIASDLGVILRIRPLIVEKLQES